MYQEAYAIMLDQLILFHCQHESFVKFIGGANNCIL